MGEAKLRQEEIDQKKAQDAAMRQAQAQQAQYVATLKQLTDEYPTLYVNDFSFSMIHDGATRVAFLEAPFPGMAPVPRGNFIVQFAVFEKFCQAGLQFVEKVREAQEGAGLAPKNAAPAAVASGFTTDGVAAESFEVDKEPSPDMNNGGDL
jgi:hypothetical protein